MLNCAARSLQADVAVGGAATGYGAAGAAANVQGGQASTSTTATTQLTVDPWELGKTYPNLNAKVGQTITWKWTNGPHGVFRIPSNTCPTVRSPLEVGLVLAGSAQCSLSTRQRAARRLLQTRILAPALKPALVL